MICQLMTFYGEVARFSRLFVNRVPWYRTVPYRTVAILACLALPGERLFRRPATA